MSGCVLSHAHTHTVAAAVLATKTHFFLFWSWTLNLTLGCCALSCCQAQWSGARLGDHDVAPVAVLQSRPRERQMYVKVLVPAPASSSQVISQGVSKYVSDQVRHPSLLTSKLDGDSEHPVKLQLHVAI